MQLTTNSICVALALASAASAQNTWHVDLNGTPPGTGTPADPYTSIQYAIDSATTLVDDVLLVAPGTYVENIHDDAGKRVKVASSGGPLVTTLKPALTNQTAVSWNSFSTIEGFTVTGYASQSPVQGAVSVYGGYAVRCVIRNNAGTGLFSDSGYARQCTIVDNGLGVVSEYFGSVDLRNTLVWSNDTDFFFGAFAPIANYCGGNLPPEASGVGNVVGDPLVWEAPQARHFLHAGSPCIDAGDPSLFDPDGTRLDIGAIPFDALYAPPPTAYCTAKTNSFGCVPAIGASGHASASGAAFTITCANERSHKLGLLFYGFVSNNAAYQGGWLCVEAPVHRTVPSNSGGNAGVEDCSGVYSFDFDALIQSGNDPALVAGELVYAQFWSRDSAASFATVRSDALRFGIAP